MQCLLIEAGKPHACRWVVVPHFGWRVYTVVAVLPTLLCCVLVVAFVPESPRWLVVHGGGHGPELATKVIHKI